MTDQELIVECAEKVMGWETVSRKSFRSTYHPYPERGAYPYLVVFANARTVLWRNKQQDHSDDTWNPLASDADAFMLVDALERVSCDFILEKSGLNWTATFGGCHGASGCGRRRAIVFAALLAVNARVA